MPRRYRSQIEEKEFLESFLKFKTPECLKRHCFKHFSHGGKFQRFLDDSK